MFDLLTRMVVGCQLTHYLEFIFTKICSEHASFCNRCSSLPVEPGVHGKGTHVMW